MKINPAYKNTDDKDLSLSELKTKYGLTEGYIVPETLEKEIAQSMKNGARAAIARFATGSIRYVPTNDTIRDGTASRAQRATVDRMAKLSDTELLDEVASILTQEVISVFEKALIEHADKLIHFDQQANARKGKNKNKKQK